MSIQLRSPCLRLKKASLESPSKVGMLTIRRMIQLPVRVSRLTQPRSLMHLPFSADTKIRLDESGEDSHISRILGTARRIRTREGIVGHKMARKLPPYSQYLTQVMSITPPLNHTVVIASHQMSTLPDYI